MCANASAWVGVGTTALLRVSPTAGSSGGCSVGLGVTVGACDDHVEGCAPLASIGCGSIIDDRAPKSTLVIGDRGWVWTAVLA